MKEYDRYRSVYCSLCKRLGKRFGIMARFTLSYDCTFLSILSLSLQEQCSGVTDGRCVCNPLKKCFFCKGGEENLDFAAAVSVVMTYYKLEDDRKDSRFWGKIKAAFFSLLFRGAYRKAKKNFPEIDKVVSEQMDNQAKYEASGEKGIDQSAEATARMLSKICVMIAKDETERRVLKQFGYYIGRWVYLIDAADDMETDQKENNFNPFLKLLEEKKAELGETFCPEEYINGILNQTLYHAISSYQLLELKHFDAIIENIMMLGLPMIQKQILFDKERDKKNVGSL